MAAAAVSTPADGVAEANALKVSTRPRRSNVAARAAASSAFPVIYSRTSAP